MLIFDSEQSKLDNFSKVDEFGENVNAQEKGKGNEYLQRMAPSLQLISEKLPPRSRRWNYFRRTSMKNFEKFVLKLKKIQLRLSKLSERY